MVNFCRDFGQKYKLKYFFSEVYAMFSQESVDVLRRIYWNLILSQGVNFIFRCFKIIITHLKFTMPKIR